MSIIQVPKKYKNSNQIHYHPVIFDFLEVDKPENLLSYLSHLNSTHNYKHQILNVGSVYYISKPHIATPDFSPGLYSVTVYPDEIIYTMMYGKSTRRYYTHYCFLNHKLVEITGDSPIPTYVFEALKSIYQGVIYLPESVSVSNHYTSFKIEDVMYTSKYDSKDLTITLSSKGEILTVYNLPKNSNG